MLQQIAEDIWVATQKQKFMGLSVGTRMTVIRLANNSNNSLLLISPIAISPELKLQLDELGTVRYLIAPNLFHYLYLAEGGKLYPAARIVAPPGLAAKQPNLRIDLVLTQDEINFNGELEYQLLAGFQVLMIPQIATANEIVFYHPASKTLIITDSAFNFDDSYPLVTQFAARIIDSYQTLKPSWLEKIAVQDKQLLKKAIAKILQWDFERVIMAHGKIVDTDAKQQLTQGYQWLVS